MEPHSLSASSTTNCASSSDTCLALKTLFSRAAASSGREDRGSGRGRLRLSPGRSYRDWVAKLAWHLDSLLLKPKLYRLFLLLWEQPVVNSAPPSDVVRKQRLLSHRFESQLRVWGCMSSCQ